MNEIDIFERLASNLTERKTSAALSNYEVLCNNISFSHELFEKALVYYSDIVENIRHTFENSDSLAVDFEKEKTLHSFSVVIPCLLSNDIETIQKLSSYTLPDNRSDITVENVGLLHRGFRDYSDLVTATRQFIDSLISDTYQLLSLDPKEFNYHVLLSLNSFEKYATKSIRQGLFNDDIEGALAQFRTLRFRDWKNSQFTKCRYPSFANKVDFIFSELNKSDQHDIDFQNQIKDLFKFSSEFTHVGYVSTFFSSKSGSEVIFGGGESPYLPSTENFSELKYQILESCITFIYQVYLPVLALCMSKILKATYGNPIQNDIDNLIKMLSAGIKTRNNSYYFFVRSELINSKETIDLPCICGHKNQWVPPHKNSDLFCRGCGSSYTVLGLDGDPGYIITSNGPVKVIGSEVPDFDDLSPEKQKELLMNFTNTFSKMDGS